MDRRRKRIHKLFGMIPAERLEAFFENALNHAERGLGKDEEMSARGHLEMGKAALENLKLIAELELMAVERQKRLCDLRMKLEEKEGGESRPQRIEINFRGPKADLPEEPKPDGE